MPDPDLTNHPHRPPACASAPVLWSLLPLVMGIVSGKTGFLPISVLPWMVTIAVSLFISGSRRIIILTSFLLGFLVQWSSVVHPHPDWQFLPKREAGILLEVKELFNARDPERISGIGKIIQTDIPHDTVTGKGISFYLKVTIPGHKSPVQGELLSCRGVITYLPSLAEPDGFQQYLLGRNIFTTINQGTVLEKAGSASPVECIRMRLFSFYQNMLRGNSAGKEPPGNVLASMLLGDRSLLSNDRVDLYRRTGTYHLFAVSGLHVGCVALFLASICRFTGTPGKWIPLPVLLACWYYVWLTGSSPSAVRAGIMITCLMLSRALLRQPHLFPALVLSAWLVLLLYPQQLFDLGFQLSYSVVASILLIGLPAARGITQWLNLRIQLAATVALRQRLVLKTTCGLIDICCISFSASLISIPLIIEHFQLFTPFGIIVGIFLNPLASLTITLGCISLCMAPVSAAIASLATKLAIPVIVLIEWILNQCVRVPGAYSHREWMMPCSGTIAVILVLGSAWIFQYLNQHSKLPAGAYLIVPLLFVLGGFIFGTLSA